MKEETIEVRGAAEHNLKSLDVSIERGKVTVITGVSGSGKSSLAFDTILAEAQRRFFHTLSHYSRQFLDMQARPAVRQITGLSPAIALQQNETQPSRRATVGTQTDLSELIGVMLARFGAQHCPDHGLPTAAESAAEISSRLLKQFGTDAGIQLALCAPLADQKKGAFKAQLTAAAKKGFLKALIDGELASLTSPPSLNKEEKHTIKIVVDYVRLKAGAESRLARAIEIALAEGAGFGEYYVAEKGGDLHLDQGGAFATKGGCPTCGFTWPRLDSRHFSANSLGRCEACSGLGTQAKSLASGEGEDGEEAALSLYVLERTGRVAPCSQCQGTGLDKKLRGIKLGHLDTHDLHTLDIETLTKFMARFTASENPAEKRVADEVIAILRRIDTIGLGYLSLSRRVRSLSGGEAQRLRLAGILSDSLSGVLYILDEPSQGLHPTEIDRLWAGVARLRDSGNTVLIVDHDEQLMRLADWIIDLGPGGGARGGKLTGKFRPSEAAHFVRQSLTARHLATVHGRLDSQSSAFAKDTPKCFSLSGVEFRNLRIPSISFPYGAFTVVAGVSGAGKTSLTLGTLLPNLEQVISGKKARWIHCLEFVGGELATSVELIDRRPLAKSSVSMPATYLDVISEIRELFEKLPDAQVAGLTARSFSLSAGDGRCPECKGRGEINLTMRFLADARVRCGVCKGARYRPIVLSVRYDDLTIADILNMTLDEVLERFKHHKKISQRLRPAVDLGLGYLKLGQPSSSLSGGEAQRLKLVPYLAKSRGDGAVLILDEPTTGLHFEDVTRLLAILRGMVERGATVIAIEHSSDVIRAADWLIELGPGAAKSGGRVVYAGAPHLKDACQKH